MNIDDRSVKQHLLALAVFLGLCALVAALGSVFTMAGMDGWYSSLEQPDWDPPDWVFGPVWSVLYIAIGVSAWLVWKATNWSVARVPIIVWVIQLGLNLLWTALFFGLEQPGLASIEIVALWLAILTTIVLFWPISKLAAIMLIPYLAWVSYAAALTISIWRLN